MCVCVRERERASEGEGEWKSRSTSGLVTATKRKRIKVVLIEWCRRRLKRTVLKSLRTWRYKGYRVWWWWMDEKERSCVYRRGGGKSVRARRDIGRGNRNTWFVYIKLLLLLFKCA